MEPTEFQAILDVRDTEKMSRMLDQLSPRYKRVMELRYGLNGEKEHTLEEIGKEFNTTRQRVRQSVIYAIKKLQKIARQDQESEKNTDAK